MTKRAITIETGVVLLVYTVVTCVLFWPIPVELSTSVIGLFESDAPGGVWFFDALQETGFHLFGTTTFEQVAVPFGYEQANSLNLQTLLPNYPTYLATKIVGEVAAYNLSVLIGFVLSGAAMYLLARRVGAEPPVAVWAGLAWLLFPWHVERALAGHPAYVHTACLPILVVAMHAYWKRPDPRRLVLVGLAVVACWLTAGIFGVMALVLVLVCGAVTVLLTRPHRYGLLSGALLAGSAVVASGLVYGIALPGGGDGGIGASRALIDLRRGGLRLAELVVPAPRSGVLGNALADNHEEALHASNIQETSNYLGWVTIVLATIGVVVLWRTRRNHARANRILGAGLVASALVALALALPSPIWLLGYRWDRTPARLLFDVLPAFRVPARWSVVLMLAAVTLGAIGLQATLRYMEGRGRLAAPAALGVVVGLTLVELVSPVGQFRFDARSVPAAYALLARTEPGRLAEYPLFRSDTLANAGYLFWQREHRRPLVNGADSNSPDDSLRRALIDPKAPGIAGQLAALGVTAIMTRFDDSAEARLRRSGYALAGTAPDGVAVWRVTAAPAPAIVTLSSNFADPDPWGDRAVQRLFGSRGAIELRADAAISGTLEMTVLARGAARRQIQVGRLPYVVNSRGTTIRFPFTAREGSSRVPIRIEGIAPGDVGLAATVPTLTTAGDSR